MWANEPRSLPDWIERAYRTLASRSAGSDEGIPRERARDLLLAREGFPEEAADATHAIDRLLDTGWLYQVDGELRITDPAR